jgi:adenosylcobyric acid synthase
MGCYLHGLFDSKPACDALLRHAGLTTPDSPDYRQICEASIDRLADAVAEHLDQTALLRLLGLSGKIER